MIQQASTHLSINAIVFPLRFILVTFMLMTNALPVWAQAHYYISPNLQLGLHTQASLNSPIKTLLSSGTVVQIIKTNKDFSQIKTADNKVGWIKSQFISQQEPASVKVKKLQYALDQALKTSPETAPAVSSSLQKNNSNSSDATINNYKNTISALREELKAWEQLDFQDKQAQKIQAEKSNQQLKQRLSMIATLASGREVAKEQFDISSLIQAPATTDNKQYYFSSLLKKNYLLLMMVSGVSFLLGIFVMDLINRRRHGGYRV